MASALAVELERMADNYIMEMVVIDRCFGNIPRDRAEAVAVWEHPHVHTSPDNSNQTADIRINLYISGD